MIKYKVDMNLPRNKIKLSPRLKWGVGRKGFNINFFKIGGGIFIAMSAVLFIQAGYKLISGGDKPVIQGEVKGATDTQSTSQAFTEYKVKTGDTLFTISKENNVQWTALATINNLKAPFTLHSGQLLKIPK